ncbi:amidohydrolase family protein [Palaeococcus ferrophilus]|uniref:amidohydrolase family protein n=1 Tax=Palaeococcus ferrophilus TaxID=83868 RepID=UPI00064E8301|nr:amidohydrolase [Palaeococcus ferrophilus]
MKAITGDVLDVNGLRRDMAVLIEGEHIADVVPRERLGEYGVDEVFEGDLIIPGLVNAHTHVAMAKFRGLGEGLSTAQWLERVIWPMEREWTEKDVERWALLGIAEALSNGSTTINDHYFFAEGIARAAKRLGIRAFIGQTVMDVVDFPLAAPEKGFRFFRRWKGKDELVRPVMAPHATNTVSLELMRDIGDFARENGALIHIHLAQSEEEVREVRKRYELRPVEYLNEAGVLGENLIGVHGVYLGEDELALLGKARSTLVHCPTSNLRLEKKTINIAALRRMGVRTALGNDSPNPVGLMDPFREMFVAALAASAAGRYLSPRDVFEMATLEGARALGIRAGLVERGYLADLVVLNTRKPQFLPGEDPFSHILYSTRGSDVEMVFVGGEPVYEQGFFPGLGKRVEELTSQFSSRAPSSGE